jgi:allophanate hydrolase
VIGIGAYAARYAAGESVTAVLGAALAALEPDDPVWITQASREAVQARAAALDACSPAERAAMPLFGVPFGVKDNIDVAGLPTTAACPAFAYMPEQSATVVARLEAAGAVVFGKTNLDQFATGLVGVRSPYGVPRNPFDARYIPGGSSSGSAVAVARGLVAFALGTDTAGSGRVPAGFTATVGLKPTFGTISAAGVVPAHSIACRSSRRPSTMRKRCMPSPQPSMRAMRSRVPVRLRRRRCRRRFTLPCPIR